MAILLFGKNGQIGSEIVELAQLKGISLLALGRQDVDLCDTDHVYQIILASKPQIVINAAAYTAVDKAEKEPEIAFKINRDAPLAMAQACKNLAIPLIDISTDYIFNGQSKQPYTETDKAAPLGTYGNSKWQGEQAIRDTIDKHIILRVSWVFGKHGNNFVKAILNLAKEREILTIVNDQRGCPTAAKHIAETLLQIIKQLNQHKNPWGTYHYCDNPALTWYEFARAIVEAAHQYTDLKVNTIKPITTAEYPTPSQRPHYSVLNCAKIYEYFNITSKDWHNGLQAVLKEII